VTFPAGKSAAAPGAPQAWSLARQLRRRLLVAMAVLWTAAAILAVIAVRAEINDVLDGALLSLAEHIPLDEKAETMATTPALFAAPPSSADVLHVLVRDSKGKILRQSGLTTGAAWSIDSEPGLRTVDGWRVATRRTPDDAIIVQVGEQLRERHDALAESSAAMILPLLALLPLAALMIDLLLERSFKGVREAGDQWRARAETDLSPLQATDLPTEFDPLIESINTLVTRLQAVVRAERAFAASSAHELRTPLAAARAQAQLLVAKLPEGEPHDRALGLVRSLDRLSNTATKLLQLSRVESGIGLARESLDLRQLATLILDEFRHHADVSHRLRVHLPEEPVVVRGDLDALGIAMRNLIENALKHAPLAHVDVRIEAPGRVIVSDDGPGVSPETLATLSLPYSRGPARNEGTGLGLSIAAKIAEQQNATLWLESPPPGQPHGFRATLSIEPDPLG
jgi:two-component system OmpR family sensor kinase